MFLHPWDEQYHALVAKNMMDDFLNPVLYKNPLLSTSNHWTGSHIWLHKQPAFLCQIALSFKLFGVSEFSLHLPNILAHGIILIFIHDIGTISVNKKVGFISSLLFCFLKFPLTYLAGFYATDHNDYMFLFYVTAAVWALFKYHTTQNKIYLILLGLFTGISVLIKWLTGFIVLGVWTSYIVLSERKFILKPIISFIVALIVFLPWQIYHYIYNQSLFLNEMAFNNKHIFKVLENHGGDWFFHINSIRDLYSNHLIIFFIIPISIFIFLYNKNIPFFYKYFFSAFTLITYLFFSFVKTKMPAFCIITIPIILVIIANAVFQAISLIKNNYVRKTLSAIFISQLIVLFFSPSYFLKKHTFGYSPQENQMRKNLTEKTLIFELGKKFQNKNIVYINAGDLDIKIMFYLNCDATVKTPSADIIEKLKIKHYKIIAFKQNLPDYILNDPSIIKI